MKELVIIYGGRSCEHDISIITALYAYHAVKLKDYNKTLVYLYKGNFLVGGTLSDMDSYIKFDERKYKKVYFSDGRMYGASKRMKKATEVTCALVCTHGGEGENGALQGCLEVANIPYTSSGVTESAVTIDKILTKKLLQIRGYATVPYAALRDGDGADKAEELNFPLIVKPSRLGSSIGISKVRNDGELKCALELAFKYDDSVLVESCLEDFMELNCAAISHSGEVLVSGIERPYCGGDFLTYAEKYIYGEKNTPAKEFPAIISADLEHRIKKLTESVYRDFRLSGVVRVDYLVKDGKVFVNEINSVPGSLAYYLFPKEIGISGLAEMMIDEGTARFRSERRRLTSTFVSNVLSHYKGGKAGIKK